MGRWAAGQGCSTLGASCSRWGRCGPHCCCHRHSKTISHCCLMMLSVFRDGMQAWLSSRWRAKHAAAAGGKFYTDGAVLGPGARTHTCPFAAAYQPSVCARLGIRSTQLPPTFQLWEHSSDQKASAAAVCCSSLALPSCRRRRQEQLSAPHLPWPPTISCARSCAADCHALVLSAGAVSGAVPQAAAARRRHCNVVDPMIGSVLAAADAVVHTHHQCVQRLACAQLEEVGRPAAGEVLPDGIRCSLALHGATVSAMVGSR